MTRGVYYFGAKLPLVAFLFSLFFIPPLHAQEETEIEEIVVIGVRSSIEKSIDDKRNASGIKDVITAEDIGQLPDENIAEALQRVTGIQMARTAEGGGSTVQIRGVSNNNVQINGQDFVGGVGGDRSVNFGDIPSELFSGIEVLKTQTASQTEGSLGGTVNFKTRRPLDINKQRFGSVGIKGKYADITQDDNQHPLDRFPDVNVFVARNFRDTGIGDIGILANFNRKLNIARSDAFGGGDYSTAPAVWARYLGNEAITPLPGPIRQETQDWNLAKTNLLDPNGDGTRDAKDVYYTPADFIAHSRYVETETSSLNATLQWQPSYNLNFFMDYTTTNTDEKRNGSQFRVITPRANMVPLTHNPHDTALNQRNYAGCPPTQTGCEDYTYPLGFEKLGTTPTYGDVYYLTHMTMMGANIRFGGTPSHRTVDRQNNKLTIGGDWEFSEKLFIKFQANIAEGKTTNNQSQLNMSHDMNRDGRHGGGFDNLAVLSFDLRNVDLVDINYYQAPYNVTLFNRFQLTTHPVDLTRADLTEIDPNDTSYERLAYYSLRRTANDTENGANSAQIDLEYKPDNGFDFFKKILSGIRIGERSFSRRNYENVNEAFPLRANFSSNAAYTERVRELYAPDANGKVQRVYIQDIRVDPAANIAGNFFNQYPANTVFSPGTIPAEVKALARSFAQNQKVAQDFADNCLGTGNVQFKGLSGNFPLSWPRTNCGPRFFENYFNLHDIRAKNADGTGIYEQKRSFYDITEDTYNAYIQANFSRQLFGKRLFGNMGVRYAHTDITSTGFIINEDGDSFSEQVFTGTTKDFLPSLNANLWLTPKMILRLGLYRSLTRPGIFALSPSIGAVDYENLTATAGNPSVEPIRSNSFDLSYEYYYKRDALFSLAVFHKDIDSTLALEDNQRKELIGGEEFSIRSYANQEGTKIQGVEIALQHVLDIEGFWSNFGFGANYTYTDEDTELLDQEGDPIPRARLSKHSYNISAFYDDGKLSIRLAYNWRDDFVRRQKVTLGAGSDYQLPEWEKARGQLDLSINYSFNPTLKLNLSAVNINRSRTVRYMKYEALQNYLAQSGARYTISLIQRF